MHLARGGPTSGGRHAKGVNYSAKYFVSVLGCCKKYTCHSFFLSSSLESQGIKKKTQSCIVRYLRKRKPSPCCSFAKMIDPLKLDNFAISRLPQRPFSPKSNMCMTHPTILSVQKITYEARDYQSIFAFNLKIERIAPAGR